jgi:hypothetical protein
MNEQGASTDFLKQCELANKIMRLGQSHITNVHEELWHQDVTKAAALLSSYAQSERNKALLELMEEIRLAIGHVTLNRQGWAPMERYLAVIESRRDELAAAIRESK